MDKPRDFCGVFAVSEEFKKARDEASANYQVSDPGFCGVDTEKHETFQQGADWAYEWISQSSEMLDVIEKQQAIIDRLKEALELIRAAYDRGDIGIVPGDLNYIEQMDEYARQALADVKKMESNES